MLKQSGRAAVAVASALWLANPVPAHAQATDAVYGCGASPIDSESAYVPAGARLHTLWKVPTVHGYVDVKCGNGKMWGAVHVELKHDVPNWIDAVTCIQKTINRGTPSDGGDNKTEYTYRISSTTTTIAVVGSVNGLVTAYPTGTDVVSKWRQCSAS